MNKVYIVAKTQINKFGNDRFEIDCVFELKDDAKKYIYDKNSRSQYIRYVIKTKGVK